MFNTVVTLIRGRSHDAAQSLADANALSILRQQLRDAASGVEAARRPVTASLAEAEATLTRLQDRQFHAEATAAAVIELSAGQSAEAISARLAAAGCGPLLKPDAAAVLARLKARTG